MIKIHTHQNNQETITLNISKETDIQGPRYLSQNIYSIEVAKTLLQQLNQASFELSEWIEYRKKSQPSTPSLRRLGKFNLSS